MRKPLFQILLVSLAALSAAACATAPASPEKRMQAQQTTPSCEGEADCKAKWEAAQLWVVHNADFKVQLATDALIETYGGKGISVRVTKEPLGAGRYKIVVFVYCGNAFGCKFNPWDGAINFNHTVGAARP